MASETQVSQHASKMVVTEVTDVVVSEVVESGGIHTRAIRIYGTPSGNGIPPVLEVQIKSDTAENLKLTTPELNF